MKETKRIKYLCFFAGICVLAFSLKLISQQGASTLHLAKAHHQGQFNALLSEGFQYWDHGSLITFALNGEIDVSPNRSAVILYNKHGQITREATVWLPGAEDVNVTGAAVSESGYLVVSGGTISPQGAIATYIAEIGPDNRVEKAIQTSPFSPKYLCAMNDGTVWSYGQDRDDHYENIPNSLRLRHYSFEKGQLQALLDTTSLNSDGWVLERGRYSGEVNLRCNEKELALYNAGSSELVEFDFSTKKMKVTKVDSVPDPPAFVISGFALTESGEIFAGFHDHTQKPTVSGLFHLSRDPASGTAKWVPIEGTVGTHLHGSPIHQLEGADGDELVYTSLKDGKMFWSKQETSITTQALH